METEVSPLNVGGGLSGPPEAHTEHYLFPLTMQGKALEQLLDSGKGSVRIASLISSACQRVSLFEAYQCTSRIGLIITSTPN